MDPEPAATPVQAGGGDFAPTPDLTQTLPYPTFTDLTRWTAPHPR